MVGDFWIRGERILHDSTQISIVGPESSAEGTDATTVKSIMLQLKKKQGGGVKKIF